MSCFQKYLGGASIESGWSFLHNNILSFIYAYIPFVHLSAFTVSLPPSCINSILMELLIRFSL